MSASASTGLLRPAPGVPWTADRLVPAVLALVGLAVVGLAVAGVSTPASAGVRGLLTPTYLLLGPGWAIAGLLRGSTLPARAVLALASGLAVSVLIGQAMAVTEFWHPVGMLYVVALLTEPLLVVHALRGPRP